MGLSEHVVRALVRSEDWQRTFLELTEAGLASSAATALIECLRPVDSHSLSELAAWYGRIEDQSVASVGLLRHLAANGGSYPHYSAEFIAIFDSQLELPQDRALLELVRVRQFADSGTPLKAIEAMARLQRTLEEVPAGFVCSSLSVWHHLYASNAYRRLGNLRKAAERLGEGLRVIAPEDMRFGLLFRQRMASLQWLAGNLRSALGLHCTAGDREHARSHGDWNHLIRSHLSAAKCAIDLQLAAKANQELIDAQELIESTPQVERTLRPYLILYSAELDTLWNNHREGIHLFEYAIELFGEIDPPYYPGILDAKVSLIQFALREGDYELVFKRIAELLVEAEERGCLDARSRLLVYQANLLLDKGAGKRTLAKGYEDLSHRVHLMNNPRLTFIACANLYSYAREYLSDYDQKFWLERMRGLEPLLEASCFDDLYRAYVLERYRHEIEGPLDQLESDLRRLDD